MENKVLTDKEKVMVVANTKELTDAIALLTALFKDLNLKEHITYVYEMGDEKFEFIFRPKQNVTEPSSEIELYTKEEVEKLIKNVLGDFQAEGCPNFPKDERGSWLVWMQKWKMKNLKCLI